MQERTEQRQPWTLYQNLLLTLPFLLWFYVQLAHHTLWRDELNAFGIAAGSPTLGALYQNVRYEGHPWLLYVLFWLLAKVTHAPLIMKWMQAVVVTGIYAMLGLFSPFRWWEKVLLFLGYYIAFEYTVLTRMYGIVLLLAMVYLWRRTHRPENLMGNAVVLGLMACADITGVFLSWALLAEYLYRLWRPGVVATPRPARRTWMGASLLYLLFLLSAVLSMLPQPDAGSKVNMGALYGYTRHDFHLTRVLDGYVVIPYLPTATGAPGSFWDTTAYVHFHRFTVLLPLVLLVYWLVLRRFPNLLVLLGTYLLLAVSFGYLVYLGKPRHYGMTSIAFVACLWLLRATGQRIQPLAYALLGLSAVGGLHAMAASWQRPFSNDEAVARYLNDSGLSRMPMVGSEDFTTFGVAVAAQKPMYMVDCNCARSFLRINAARDSYTWDQLPERMPAAQRYVGVTTFPLVTEHVLTPRDVAELAKRHFAVTLLRQFSGAEVAEDNFWVYLVTYTP